MLIIPVILCEIETNDTVLVTKKHQEFKTLPQQNHVLKVHVDSVQNPVLECFYDLWL